MSSSPEPRLTELFVRYWDDTLTPAEADELERLLATDAGARDGFQFLCVQAVAVAELPAVSRAGQEPQPARRRLSRRGLLAAGLAASVGGAALVTWAWGYTGSGARLTAVQGRVTVLTADGSRVPARGRVPAGATVSTQGPGSLAVLSFSNGTTVALLGDSALTVGDGELRLHQGTASADLRPQYPGDGLRLVTTLVSLVAVGGTVVTLGQGERAAEVEVHKGRASVAAPSGEPLAVVGGGEMLTVDANGSTRQEPIRRPPEEFALNLAEPLPLGWHVGHREVGSDGPVLRPDAWPDPYHGNAVLFQIRSDHQWARGLFAVTGGSVFEVRYRTRGAAPRGQVCVCVRTEHSHASDTGVLEYNGGFEATDGRWRWLRVRAGDMLDNRHAPQFAAPWIGFLLIVNTFDTDVGLEIAELRVTRPGRR
ncbi:FecR protein [Gemmata obscuriglobus]|uniref:FecR protein domain-containing protein n=1 Tax=Gemmata obscuriglobus TaxID=114 RepID=A0A2Z3HIM7_9BACT|nr:FecR domain-containing protein [Gemmata obscuriglobus]AWM41330.1 hypothetical protein C1280_32925 [Gemmata obscuriglobus]QEG25318.1 FecR protein [Gemmata obscuriglobus]VTR98216.1 : FecR [Gemmata obscuriglobus UQM 2246]